MRCYGSSYDYRYSNLVAGRVTDCFILFYYLFYMYM